MFSQTTNFRHSFTKLLPKYRLDFFLYLTIINIKKRQVIVGLEHCLIKPVKSLQDLMGFAFLLC